MSQTFIDAIGDWLADRVNLRISTTFQQTLETTMSAVNDNLATLQTSVQTLHDDVATAVTTLGTLQTQITNLTNQVNAGADDPAVLASIQQIQATADDAKAQIEGALNPAPVPAPATPPTTGTGTPLVPGNPPQTPPAP